MEREEHIARHKELHSSLDELIADFFIHTKSLPSTTTVMRLIEWSQSQTLKPDEEV